MTNGLRLKTPSDVRLFTAAITAIVLSSVNLWDFVYMSTEVFHDTRLGSNAISAALSATLAYFVGNQVLKVEDLTRQLEYQASYDALTSTLSRARFYQRCEHEAEVLFPAMLMVLDIDFFKRVNDIYGHAAGDQALRHVAQTILLNCRATDLVARFGGEEFLLLVPGATPLDGLGIAERIRRNIAETPVGLDDVTVAITVSIGVAQAAGPDRLDAAVREADAALYEAKNGGRNQVRPADPGVAAVRGSGPRRDGGHVRSRSQP